MQFFPPALRTLLSCNFEPSQTGFFYRCHLWSSICYKCYIQCFSRRRKKNLKPFHKKQLHDLIAKFVNIFINQKFFSLSLYSAADPNQSCLEKIQQIHPPSQQRLGHARAKWKCCIAEVVFELLLCQVIFDSWQKSF